MKKMQEKNEIYTYTRKSTNSPSNQVIGMANTNFQLKRVATKAQGFSMIKDHTPPETKTNKTSVKLNQGRQLPLK
jgi:hypothetical protein